MPSENRPFQMAHESGNVDRQIQNHLNALDTEGRVHVIRVESTRRVTRTVHGAIVQTGGDRFFLDTNGQPLVLDPETGKLRTEDGLQEFTFRIG